MYIFFLAHIDGLNMPRGLQDLNSFGHNTRNSIYCYYICPSLFFLCSHRWGGRGCFYIVYISIVMCFIYYFKSLLSVFFLTVNCLLLLTTITFYFHCICCCCCLFCQKYTLCNTLLNILACVPTLSSSLSLHAMHGISFFPCWCSIFFNIVFFLFAFRHHKLKVSTNNNNTLIKNK